ncbi:DDE-type integrase/transposase/recombinase [Shimia sp.]|uniref:DDE-type integrase/transposase/recombinase n=1 Tax=Shimia sp. TaxID=1954381 RepID=UPI003299FB4F
MDRSTVYRWVLKFGPELNRRTETHLRRTSFDWHLDETYIRVDGQWRYLWRAVDTNDQMFDFERDRDHQNNQTRPHLSQETRCSG